jgi:hypothetical protein
MGVRLPTAQDVDQANLGALRAPTLKVTADDFGAGLGKGLQEAGTEIQAVALDEYNKDNEADFDRLKSDFSKRMRGLERGTLNEATGQYEGGYKALKGEAAVAGRLEYENRVDEAYQEVLGQAANKTVARKFESWGLGRSDITKGALADHEQAQRVLGRERAAEDYVTDQQEEAINYSSGGYAASSKFIDDAEVKLVSYYMSSDVGMTRDEAVTKARQKTTEMHVKVVDFLASEVGGAEAAQKYLEDAVAAGKINASSLAAVRNRIKEPKLLRTAQEAGDTAAKKFNLQQPGGAAKAQAWVHQNYEGEEERAAIAEVNARISEAQALERGQTASTARTAVDAAVTGVDLTTPAGRLAAQKKVDGIKDAETRAQAQQFLNGEVTRAKAMDELERKQTTAGVLENAKKHYDLSDPAQAKMAVQVYGGLYAGEQRDDILKAIRTEADAQWQQKRREDTVRFDAAVEASLADARAKKPLNNSLLRGLSEKERLYVERKHAEARALAENPNHLRTGDGGTTWAEFYDVSRDPEKLASYTLAQLKTAFEMGVTDDQWRKTILPTWASISRSVEARQYAQDNAEAVHAGVTRKQRVDNAMVAAGLNPKQEKQWGAFSTEFDARVRAQDAGKDTDKQQAILDQMVKEKIVYDKAERIGGVALSSDAEKLWYMMTAGDKETMAEDMNLSQSDQDKFVSVFDELARQLRTAKPRPLPVTRANIIYAWKAWQQTQTGRKGP